ncbi:MAG: hypothetical protein HY300_10180, partial [Verrucomicrobia bacterium]|nr:hypothetical protein [Verrucomicrobiota bacterium]
MASIAWPPAEKRALIGKRIDRADGPAKATGAAKYSYDINRPGMLYAKLVTSPHALAELVSVDTGPAAALKGVKAVWKDDDLIGKEVQYIGQIVAAVAAETEEIATEAAELVKVTYKPKQHQVVDNDVKFFDAAKDKPATKNVGNFDTATRRRMPATRYQTRPTSRPRPPSPASTAPGIAASGAISIAPAAATATPPINTRIEIMSTLRASPKARSRARAVSRIFW